MRGLSRKSNYFLKMQYVLFWGCSTKWENQYYSDASSLHFSLSKIKFLFEIPIPTREQNSNQASSFSNFQPNRKTFNLFPDELLLLATLPCWVWSHLPLPADFIFPANKVKSTAKKCNPAIWLPVWHVASSALPSLYLSGNATHNNWRGRVNNRFPVATAAEAGKAKLPLTISLVRLKVKGHMLDYSRWYRLRSAQLVVNRSKNKGKIANVLSGENKSG